MTTIKLELNPKQEGAFLLFENDEKIGEMVLSISNETITVYHTEVDEKYSGKGYAKLLLDELVNYTRKNNFKIIPLCPYVFAQFKRHPDDFEDIWLKN